MNGVPHLDDGLPYLDGDTVRGLVPPGRAVQALEDALRGGLDPETTPPRPVVDVPAGQLLLMPAFWGAYAGVKIATVAPDNPRRGLPRIQAVHLLLDAATLSPVATMDGTALTSLRTPAVSALAVRRLASPDARSLVVFGSGPQAWGHVAALREERPVDRVTVVARDPGGAARLAERCAAEGLTARSHPASDPAWHRAVEEADLIACCTTARTPLFPGRLVRDGAVVVAVGSHEPGARELDDDLVARAVVVVEARSAALTEAGDLVVPIRDGRITADHLAGNLADLVAGRVDPGSGPRVFKSVGMAWQDLVVAAAAYEAWTSRRGDLQ